MAQDVHVRDEGRGHSLSDYWPLVCLVVISAALAWAISIGFATLTTQNVMHAYMGFFLTVFALLKLFDPIGFKDGFAMYDILAERWPVYGYIYPLIELCLGLLYLAFVTPIATYLLTIAVFGFGAAGVLLALRRGLDIDCACMGNILSVPLATVTLTEDVLMVVMAIILLVS